eukprot:CAMPEP_0174285598 /NCGR_PEP_ID=MMETSP0809-20121228/8967_1 /TAXON_ID=73025 ORGANISM="Eutreptiella gymnastica-like, Strain CCMP1594" /NCGR_SAMPLE_ID=MMETSP0809 /ASSEMBLY_ACC=CAM_ASM_000658 /LENGTH=192 /DNA_ID=CAMNT_0015381409 /DNA_START=36 /DNA_END=614 /DNA_ORIENTATION=+
MVMEAPRVQHSRPAGYHPMVQQAPEVYPVVKLDSASKRSGRTSEAGSRPMSEISSNYSVPPPPKNFVRQVRCRSESPEPKRLSDYLDSSAFAKSRQYKGGPVYDPSGAGIPITGTYRPPVGGGKSSPQRQPRSRARDAYPQHPQPHQPQPQGSRINNIEREARASVHRQSTPPPSDCRPSTPPPVQWNRPLY